MPLATANRDGGKTDEKGIFRAVGRVVSGEVFSGFRVRQNSPLAMSVRVGGESGIVDDALIRNTTNRYVHPVFIDDATAVSLTVPTANPSNPRIDLVVMYIDYSVTPSTAVSNNTNNVVKLALIQGTAAAVPAVPSDGTISSTIGASNPYIKLAQIAVPAGATTITDSMITDTRTLTTALHSPTGLQVVQTGTMSHAALGASGGNANVVTSLTNTQPDANYYVFLTPITNGAFWTFIRARIEARTTTNFTINFYNEGSGTSGAITWAYVVVRG